MQGVTVADPVEQALAEVGEVIGELMEFWGFKRSMGKVWAALYLAARPLDAATLGERTGLSAGSVSMTLAELQEWGVVHLRREPGQRSRLYEAETDIWAMVTRVFRDRELRVVREAARRIEVALEVVDRDGRAGGGEALLRSRAVVTRLRLLLDLTRTGERMLEQLARSGEVDLGPLKTWFRALRGMLPRAS